jgi:hypothetical protein
MYQAGSEKGKVMDGICRGVPKHTKNPIVDGIVTGVPRKPHPSVATPLDKAPGSSATLVPKNAFGSGIFQESAGAPKKSGAAAGEKKKGKK